MFLVKIYLVPPISSESLSLQSEIIDKIARNIEPQQNSLARQANFPPIATSSTAKSDPHKFQWYRNKRTLLAFYLLDALNHLCLRRLSPNCVQMFRIPPRENFITNALGTPRLSHARLPNSTEEGRKNKTRLNERNYDLTNLFIHQWSLIII